MFWEEKTQYKSNESNPFSNLSPAQRNKSIMTKMAWGSYKMLVKECKLT
jgi:hypothetical protein